MVVLRAEEKRAAEIKGGVEKDTWTITVLCHKCVLVLPLLTCPCVFRVVGLLPAIPALSEVFLTGYG